MAHELRLSAGIVLSSVDQNEDKNGFATSYTFLGTKVQCEQQRFLERARGAKQIQLRPKGDGNWELVSTYPNNSEDGNGDAEQPSVTHELEVSMAQQDVWTNPKMNRNPPDGLGAALTHVVKQLVDDYKNGRWKKLPFTSAEVDVLAATGSSALALSYFRLFTLTGVDHWIFYRAVYSKTITAATPRQVRASFLGVNKLWQTNQIVSTEQLPNDWWFTLNNVHTVWHKSMPRVQTNIGRSAKTQISYQYIGSDEASALLYDNY